MKKHNIHLLTSSTLLIPIAIAYGIGADMSDVFTFEVNSIDLRNILKAIMGLYLAIVGFWIYGVLNPTYWRAATIVNVLFMLGLGSGRLVSILVDGMPSIDWIIATIAEFLIAFWGLYNLKNYKKEKAEV